MATRYWVGGTGTYDTSTTTHWSATSGGAAGASAPSPADDVIFNASSGSGTVTLSGFAYAKSVTFTSSSVSFTGSGFWLMYGSLSIQSTTTFNFTGFLLFYASATLTSGGKTFGNISTGGGGVILTLGSALTCSILTISDGDSLLTSNFNITYSGSINIGFSGATATLGTSQLTATTITGIFSVPAGSTISAASSTITFLAGGRFLGGGKTYGNVDNTTNASGSGLEITGANTFSRLTLPSTGSSLDQGRYIFAANQTITTLVCSGAAVNTRVLLIGLDTTTNAKVTVTLTVGTWTTKSDVDFCNITAAGASAPWSGTRFGNAGGNTNITGFAAPKTVYWNLAGTQDWSATGWASTSGGAPSSANYPLPQDTAVIDNASAGTTINIGNVQIGNLSASSRTSAITLALYSQPYLFGNWSVGSGVAYANNITLTFLGASQTFTNAGQTGAYTVLVSNSNTLTLGSGFTTTSGSIFIGGGSTLNTNNYNVSASSFTATGTTVTFAIGSSVVSLTSSSGAIFTGVSTLTVTGTGTISVTNASPVAKTFAGAGGNYSTVTLNKGGPGDLAITGANSFGNIATSYGGTETTSITFPASTTTTLANFTASGTLGTLLTLKSSTAGTRATLSDASGTNNVSYCSIKDLNATGGATWNAYTTNGNVDAGNNLGWNFVSLAGGNFLMFFVA